MRSLDELIEEPPVGEAVITPQEAKPDPKAWPCIGAEAVKLIGHIPGKLQYEKFMRKKFVHRDARRPPPITAPLRALQDRCITTPRRLAQTESSHSEPRLPYYHLERMHVSGQPLCGWMGMTHEACNLVIAQMKRDAFHGGYLIAYEKPVKYQHPGRDSVCGTGHPRVFHNPGRNCGLFARHPGLGAACLKDDRIDRPQGIIQCDGTLPWKRHQEGKPYPRCMRNEGNYGAHQAFIKNPEQAGPDEVSLTRQHCSAPIIAGIKARLEQLQESRRHRQANLTGEALSYEFSQRSKLGVVIDDDGVQIESKLLDNTIGPCAFGKKDRLWLSDQASNGTRCFSGRAMAVHERREKRSTGRHAPLPDQQLLPAGHRRCRLTEQNPQPLAQRDEPYHPPPRPPTLRLSITPWRNCHRVELDGGLVMRHSEGSLWWNALLWRPLFLIKLLRRMLGNCHKKAEQIARLTRKFEYIFKLVFKQLFDPVVSKASQTTLIAQFL